MTRFPCSMAQAHPIYECPMVLKSQFYHNCSSNTYVANDSTFRFEYGSGPVSGFYSENTSKVMGCQSQFTLSPR